MLFTLYTSFFEWDGLSDDWTFVGLKNYVDILFNDEVSQLALRNNLLWTAGAIIDSHRDRAGAGDRAERQHRRSTSCCARSTTRRRCCRWSPSG